MVVFCVGKIRSLFFAISTIILFSGIANAEALQQNQNILSCQKPLGRHTYYKSYECPIGGEKFSALILGSNSRFGVHLDWSPISYMRFPVALPVCPSNGLVIDRSEHTDQELADIEKVIASDEYKKIYSEKHASYYLYSKFSKMMKNEEVEQWWTLLNATWEADICADKDKYKKYAIETIEEARSKLVQLSPEDYQYWQLNLIIPNLYRRVGQFKDAKIWLENFGNQLPKKPIVQKIKWNQSFSNLE